MSTPTEADFYAAAGSPTPKGVVPRNHLDQPMIAPAPGDEKLAYKSGDHKGLIPYARASSFGSKVEDSFYVDKWKQRQVARGMGILVERGQLGRGPDGGLPRNPLVEPTEKHEKAAWDEFAEKCKEVAGSNVKADLGTAIHYGTELVDLDGDLSRLAPEVRERADAYYRAKVEWGWKPTSVEAFSVEDVHHVAGTRDRSMWFLGKHGIGDVKTSTSLDFGGLKFAVQLATYARALDYDPETQQRTPQENIDLELAWIIHVDRNPGGPVTLHPVDIAFGWRMCDLIDQVIAARSEGKKAIGTEPLTRTRAEIMACATRRDLGAYMAGRSVDMNKADLAFANNLWKVLPA